jgi:hypothetical protein
MTLDETLHSTSASECARNIVAVLRLLATLSAADIRRISAAVGNLESLLGSLGQVLDSDIVIQSTTQTTPDRDDEYARTDAMFVFLKETCHVDDPNIDMFIASSTGDTALLERALNAGADPSLRSGEVLAKYADQLATFRSSGTAR